MAEPVEHKGSALSWNDWRAWLTLGWVTVFGILYCVMVIKEKAPALLAILRLKN